MLYFDFNPFGTQEIIARFNCDDCSNPVESEEILVPSPNYSADTASESQNDNEGSAVCSNCGKEFTIDIYVSYAGGDGNIDELPDDHYVEIEEIDEPYYEDQYDAISSNTEFFETFNDGLNSIQELLKIEPIENNLKILFDNQLYSSVIGTMETYLSDAFINTVFKSKENLKRFFKSFKGFDKQNIAISGFYDFEEKSEAFAKKAMLDVIYHHLPKVAGMYKDTFSIKFPEFGEIFKAVLIRHDLIHRSGKDKNGKEVIVDSSMITKLINDVRTFITNIDEQIKDLK
jgi:hypothetical protein